MLASTHDSSDDNSSPTTDIDMPDPEDGHLLLYGWGQKKSKDKGDRPTSQVGEPGRRRRSQRRRGAWARGGLYTVNVSDFETGQVHQVDRVRVTRDTGVWRLSIDTDGAAAKTQTTNWTSSPWNTSIGAAWRTGCRRGGPSLLSFCRPETALVPWPNSVPIPRRT